uniref:Uncharacterized protein n=1 Tax=viral metagenome TaxID=1070528 RepID=A0A6M3KVW8_9ZZZZ
MSNESFRRAMEGYQVPIKTTPTIDVGVTDLYGTLLESAGTYQLHPSQRHVKCATTNTGAYTIAMPTAAECEGEIFCIYMVARDTVDVTLTDHADDTAVGDLGGADITLNLAADCVILYCDGISWRTLYSTGI